MEMGNLVCCAAGWFRFAGGFGMNVAPGTTTIGVPPIISVFPAMPGGASERGILVGPGIMRNGEPPMFTVDA